MNVQTPHGIPRETMTIEAFGAWVDTQERKYELVDGVPHLQPWVKRSHSLIAGNIAFDLRTKLDPAAFAVHTGDFAIATGPRNIRYADVFVEPAGAPHDERTTEDAVLVVEVLSDSTASVDFGPKLLEYSRLEKLDTYLIASQDNRCVWQWSRAVDGTWPDAPSIHTENAMEIAALGVVLAVDDIYRGVIEPSVA